MIDTIRYPAKKALDCIKRRGLAGSLSLAFTRLPKARTARTSVIIYRLTPGTLRTGAQPPANWFFETAAAEPVAGSDSNRKTCHVVKIGKRVAGWGFSSIPKDGRLILKETGTTLSMPLGSLCLTGFETRPKHRRKGVYVALLSHIASAFFSAEGAEIYICAVSTNTPSRGGIEKVGFVEIDRHVDRETRFGAGLGAGGPSAW